jgi:hypothetical protein
MEVLCVLCEDGTGLYPTCHDNSVRQIAAVSCKFSVEGESLIWSEVKCGAHWVNCGAHCEFWLVLPIMFSERARFGSWICFCYQK